MPANVVPRRALVINLMALPVSLRTAVAAGTDPAEGSAGLSSDCQCIHQELHLNGSPERVYEALTDASRFDALTRLSDAVTLVTAPGAKATTISSEVGGPFTLFGGYITGRHLEMVRPERLVQAWRAGRWREGDYSVVRFALSKDGGGCRLVFDHRGFPEGQGASLAYGWRVHYWQPLTKLLAQG
jgi:uncharacterized protein YndB with AHSA1/START domain